MLLLLIESWWLSVQLAAIAILVLSSKASINKLLVRRILVNIWLALRLNVIVLNCNSIVSIIIWFWFLLQYLWFFRSIKRGLPLCLSFFCLELSNISHCQILAWFLLLLWLNWCDLLVSLLYLFHSKISL